MVSGVLPVKMQTVQEMRLHMLRLGQQEQMRIKFWKIA